MKREIAKSRPGSLPRPRARRAFFSDSCSKLDIDAAFRISHKLGLGLAAKFSKAFAIQLDRFRGQYIPRPSAHPQKILDWCVSQGFPGLLAAHVHMLFDISHSRYSKLKGAFSSLGRYVFGSEISYNKAPPRLPGLAC